MCVVVFLPSSLPPFHLPFFLPLLLFFPLLSHYTSSRDFLSSSFIFLSFPPLSPLLFLSLLLSLFLSLSPFSPEGVEALPDAMKPWKDLTDQFDELSIWLEELEERVESDLAKVEDVEEGGDPSDTIVKIKVSFESLKQPQKIFILLSFLRPPGPPAKDGPTETKTTGSDRTSNCFIDL